MTYFSPNYYSHSYYPANYWSPPSSSSADSGPLIFLPFTASLLNGITTVKLSSIDVGAQIVAKLSDTPPPNATSNLTLTGATIEFAARQIGGSTVLLYNAGAAIPSLGANVVGYTLTASDLNVLVPGSYHCSFILNYSGGARAEFTSIILNIVTEAY